MIAALRHRPLIASGAAAVVALGLAGCGGSSTKTTTDPRGSQAASLQKFRTCLSEHGVKLPEGPADGKPPSGGSSGEGEPPSGDSAGGEPPSGDFHPGGGFGSGAGQSKSTEKAMEACRKYAPSFGGRGGGAGPYPGAGGTGSEGSSGEGSQD